MIIHLSGGFFSDNKWIYCYGLNCVPPQTHKLKLSPQNVMVPGDEALGENPGSWGWGPPKVFSAQNKKTWATFSALWGHGRKVSIYRPGRGLLQTLNLISCPSELWEVNSTESLVFHYSSLSWRRQKYSLKTPPTSANMHAHTHT